MTDYNRLSDDELAAEIAAATGLAPDTALRTVKSDDATLGRTWAIGVLESRDRQRERKADLQKKRGRIREYA